MLTFFFLSRKIYFPPRVIKVCSFTHNTKLQNWSTETWGAFIHLIKSQHFRFDNLHEPYAKAIIYWFFPNTSCNPIPKIVFTVLLGSCLRLYKPIVCQYFIFHRYRPLQVIAWFPWLIFLRNTMQKNNEPKNLD